jgi:hypothetical protein
MHQKPDDLGVFQARKSRHWASPRLLFAISIVALMAAMGGYEALRVVISWVFPGFPAF